MFILKEVCSIIFQVEKNEMVIIDNVKVIEILERGNFKGF